MLADLTFTIRFPNLLPNQKQKRMAVTKETLEQFICDWGQTPSEIKDNLEEIFEYEVEVDDSFVRSTGNYKWCEDYGVWITHNEITQAHEVYKSLNLS